MATAVDHTMLKQSKKIVEENAEYWRIDLQDIHLERIMSLTIDDINRLTITLLGLIKSANIQGIFDKDGTDYLRHNIDQLNDARADISNIVHFLEAKENAILERP